MAGKFGFHVRTSAASVVVVRALGVTGCSSQIVDAPAPAPVSYGCFDDSPTCVSQRQSVLRGMQADRSRAWVRQPANISAYATGVRLAAFKTEKQRLSCDESNVGRREADMAPVILRGPQGQGLQPGIVARSIMFAGDVSKELAREATRRCRA